MKRASIVLLDKEYDIWSVIDAPEDVSYAIDEKLTPELAAAPKDADGMTRGRFKVTVVWNDEE